MLPHRQRIAVAVDGDLRGLSISIIGFNQFGAAPAGTDHIAISPDIIAGAVGLPPHRQRVAVAVDGDLRTVSISCIIGLNQFSSTPAGAGHIAIGPDTAVSVIVLLPHHQCIAIVVDGNLRVCSIPCIALNQFSASPAGTGDIAIGPDIIAGAIVLVPHRQRIAAAVDGDLRVFSSPCIIGLNQFSSAPAGAGHIAIGPDIIASAIRLLPHR